MAIEIYEGLKFGQMEVVSFNEEETKKIKNKDKKWNCRCVCGREKIVGANSIRLSIKNQKNSTCDKCKSKIRIYNDMEFGSMKIIEVDDTNEMCKCVCSCGNVESMNYKFIRHSIVCNNNTKCKECKSADIKIYNGLNFGKLTVIGLDQEATKKSKREDKIYRCVCECGRFKLLPATDIRTAIKKNANSTCGLCNTFEDWCKDNDHQDWLDLWDYEKNNCKPSEISWGVHRDFYFKCPRGIHESELFFITTITRGNSMVCRKCNSFGQYLIDTHGEAAIEKYWSDKNTSTPFEISYSSDGKIKLICQDCGSDVDISCSHYIRRLRIPCKCGDGKSFPNKFIYSLLDQINLKYETEKTFDWAVIKDSKFEKLNGIKVYDVFIKLENGETVIIEVHGNQHYKHIGRGRSLKDEQANDVLKWALATKNGIDHYIELDCRESDMCWINSSVMNSKLPKILGFKESDINWEECDRYATKNLVKYACALWELYEFISVKDIADYLKIDSTTVRRYLKRGTNHRWCRYSGKKRTNVSRELIQEMI